jgi:hypothetical protein
MTPGLAKGTKTWRQHSKGGTGSAIGWPKPPIIAFCSKI